MLLAKVRKRSCRRTSQIVILATEMVRELPELQRNRRRSVRARSGENGEIAKLSMTTTGTVGLEDSFLRQLIGCVGALGTSSIPLLVLLLWVCPPDSA